MFSAACAASSLLLSACDRDAAFQAGASSKVTTAETQLLDTYQKLREWYAQGAYRALRPYIDPEYCEDVIDLLVVVDELLSANRATQEAIRHACPTCVAQRYDMAPIAENMALFSREVRVVRQDVVGGAATMVIEIVGRLPLVKIEFESRRGQWIYMPGPSNPDILAGIRDITDALNRIALVVSSEPQTPEDIESEFQFRLGPKLQRISGLADGDASRRGGASVGQLIATAPAPHTGPDPATLPSPH